MWAWGGVLGNGDSGFRALPGAMRGLSSVAAVALGSDTLAVAKDGTVWAWGNDSAPAQVNGLSSIVAVAAGGDHNVAVKNDGTVWQWSGQEAPSQLSGLTGVKALAAGWTRSVALKNDGTVWKWTLQSAPEQVPNLTGVTAITVAYEAFDWFSEDLLEARFFALRSDHTVWHWSEGPLADKYAPSAPAPIGGLAGIVAIAGGHTSLAVSEDGSVWQWHEAAETGAAPIKVEGLAGIVAVATGQEHRLALRNDGTVRAWGANSHGQLGDGTTMERAVPVQVAGLRDVIAIEASTFGSVAVKRDGAVWTWGGVNAQSRASSIPVQVVQPGSADLVIAIRHDSDFRVGSQGVYTLTIANAGESASTGTVTVTDVLPLGLSYIAATGTGWICSNADEVVTCVNPAPIDTGASSTIALTVEVGSSAWPGVTNLATVSNEGDRNISNNIIGEPTVVSPGR